MEQQNKRKQRLEVISYEGVLERTFYRRYFSSNKNNYEAIVIVRGQSNEGEWAYSILDSTMRPLYTPFKNNIEVGEFLAEHSYDLIEIDYLDFIEDMLIRNSELQLFKRVQTDVIESEG